MHASFWRTRAGLDLASRRTRAGLAFLLLAGVLGCSADGGGGTGGGGGGGATVNTADLCGKKVATGVDYAGKPEVVGKDGPLSGAAVVKIPAGGLQPGDPPATVDFELKNVAALTSAAPLVVKSFSLTATPVAGDVEPVWECFGPDGKTACKDVAWSELLLVPVSYDCAKAGDKARDSLPVRIAFHGQKEPKSHTASLKIVFQIDDKGNEVQKTVTLVTTVGAPKIQAPALVDFGTVEMGAEVTKTVQVTNVGETDLKVSDMDIALEDVKPFYITVDDLVFKGGQKPGPSFQLAKGETKDLQVHFKAINAGGHTTNLCYYSDDPKTPKLCTLLKANNNVPCLSISPSPTINFGSVKVGTKAVRQVNLSSCSNYPVQVDVVALAAAASDTFAFDLSGIKDLGGKPLSAQNPIVLAPKQAVSFPVTCQPLSLDGGPLKAKLLFHDNSIQPDKSVELLCSPSSDQCPTPLIDTPDGEQVIPLSEYNLKGEGSIGGVVKYKWTCTKHPPGAVGYSFFPNDGAANVKYGVETPDKNGGKPKISLNVSGEYSFSLDVWDAEGHKSCQIATATVLVAATEGIHAELTWATADDSDLTDNTGADLDLHFAHPNASKSNKCAAEPKFPCQPDQDGDNSADPWFQSVFDCFWNNAGPKWGSTALNGDDGTLDIDDTNGAGPENASLESPENGAQYWVGVHYWDGHGFPKSIATTNIYIYGVLKGGFTQAVSECDLWWVKRVDWPSGDLVDVPGANLALPSAGKITPKYWSFLANGMKGACKNN
jgi:hypothetical protein